MLVYLLKGTRWFQLNREQLWDPCSNNVTERFTATDDLVAIVEDNDDNGRGTRNNSSPEKPSTHPNIFFQSRVHIVQFGTSARYTQKYQNYTKRNQQWAQCMGFNYSILLENNTACPLVQKPAILDRVLSTMIDGEWLVFLDLDVQYTAPSCQGLDEFLVNITADVPPCRVMALSSPLSVNTGILFLQNHISTRTLIHEWNMKQQRERFCYGAGDQIPLQSLILQRANPYGNYSGVCERGRLRQRMFCFQDEMVVKYGHDPTKSIRSFQDICLLSCWTMGGLQCHDCPRGVCQENQRLFHHSHDGAIDLPSVQ
jgi:hypothetical protein